MAPRGSPAPRRPDATRLPALGRRGEGWLVIQMALLALAGVAGVLGPMWHGPLNAVTTAFGLAAFVAGALIVVAAARALRSALTPLPRPRDDGELVAHGLYGAVRHPIYAGVIVGAFGWGLLTASAAAIIVAAVLALFLDLKARREEVWLAQRYAAYASYRRRTRRLIPGLY